METEHKVRPIGSTFRGEGRKSYIIGHRYNELMIGDWLNLSEVDGDIIPCKVVELHTDDLVEIQPNDTACDIVGYDMVRPLPLNAEILEKNGFVTNNNHTLTGSCIYHRLCGKYEDFKVTVRLLNGWVKIESFDDRWYTLLDLSIQPRYVHELQHALRLCGLNDLADNFKI